MAPDIDAVCDQWSQNDNSDHSSASQLRRRFFEAKLAATPAHMVPNHPGGKMPWEEGGDDGGAFRSSVPMRPVLDTYNGSNSTSQNNFKWANDEYYEEDMDDFVQDWKRPLELDPDKA